MVVWVVMEVVDLYWVVVSRGGCSSTDDHDARQNLQLLKISPNFVRMMYPITRTISTTDSRKRSQIGFEVEQKTYLNKQYVSPRLRESNCHRLAYPSSPTRHQSCLTLDGEHVLEERHRC